MTPRPMSHPLVSIPPAHVARVSVTLAFSLLLGTAVSSCKSTGTSRDAAAGDPQANTEATRPVETFGAKLGNSPEVALAELLKTPNDYAGKMVRVDGHVRRACSAKGCWMELAPNADSNAAGCRVTFKDYGFFVPTDSAGAQARVEAEVALKRVGPAQVRHYEGEGATFASKHEDGSADEVRLVATGVELRR